VPEDVDANGGSDRHRLTDGARGGGTTSSGRYS
jgi:hypothetical protein